MENYIFRLTPNLYAYTHNRTNRQSLVDQGDNGGVDGENVTVINTSPHRHVNIWGIDNHDITSVTIATAGALVHSQAVPVIIVWYHIMEMGRPFIPLYTFSGIIMMRMINKIRQFFMRNGSSSMRDIFFFSSFQKDWHIFLWEPILPKIGKPYYMLS